MPHHYDRDHQKILLPNNPHIQFDWLSYNGEIIIDYWMKLEDLQLGCRILSQQFERPIHAPHINRTTKTTTEYIQYYDNEMIQIVADVCAKDIEFFNYSFGV